MRSELRFLIVRSSGRGYCGHHAMPGSKRAELVELAERIRRLAHDAAPLNNPVLDQLLSEAERELVNLVGANASKVSDPGRPSPANRQPRRETQPDQ